MTEDITVSSPKDGFPMMDCVLSPEEILANIPKYFRGTPLGRKLTIVYDIYSEGYQSYSLWTIIVDGEKCTVRQGDAEDYDTRLLIKREDYLRMVFGKMDYSNAIWMGRVRFVGNCLVHQELNTYFCFTQESRIVII